MKTTEVKADTTGIVQYGYILWFLSFCIPLVFSASQLITGILVNALLFLGAARLSKREVLPLVVFPSLGAISHGVLFGPYTPLLYYVLPFLWLGNYLLVWAYQHTISLPSLVRVALSAFLKFIFLVSIAYLFVQANILPAQFIVSLGIIQLGTAVCGGVVALGLMKVFSYERR